MMSFANGDGVTIHLASQQQQTEDVLIMDYI